MSDSLANLDILNRLEDIADGMTGKIHYSCNTRNYIILTESTAKVRFKYMGWGFTSIIQFPNIYGISKWGVEIEKMTSDTFDKIVNDPQCLGAMEDIIRIQSL